jgi:hypothetical protein
MNSWPFRLALPMYDEHNPRRLGAGIVSEYEVKEGMGK